MNVKLQLAPGDHIYSWRALGTYSHHGIVLSVSKVAIEIVDFFPEESSSEVNFRSNEIQDSSNRSTLRIRSLQEWKSIYGEPYKVIYKASYFDRTFRRSATCTSVETAPASLVMARARFLISKVRRESILSYHSLYANSETACFWCKTGEWATLQVADLLRGNIAGISVAGFVSTQTVTVPSAGVWGFLGFTRKVSLLSAQPLLLPLIVGYGIVTVGGPLWMLHRCKAKWKQYSDSLHESFWSNVKNDVAVERISKWWTLSGESDCPKSLVVNNLKKPKVISV